MSIDSKLDMYEADAAAFRGDTLDEKKMIRLNHMKTLCEMIVKIDPRVESPFIPWDNHSRHAGVQLRFPTLSFMENKAEINALSALFAEADHVFMAAPEDDGIILTLDVADIWKEFHYEYEKNF